MRARDCHDLVAGTHQNQPDGLAYLRLVLADQHRRVNRASANVGSGRAPGSEVAGKSIVNVVPTPTADST